MFAFDLNILSEEEKKYNPFINNNKDVDKEPTKKKQLTRKQKNAQLKKKLIFNIDLKKNEDCNNNDYNKYKKVKKRD